LFKDGLIGETSMHNRNELYREIKTEGLVKEGARKPQTTKDRSGVI
jgi:hypothetical protein